MVPPATGNDLFKLCLSENGTVIDCNNFNLADKSKDDMQMLYEHNHTKQVSEKRND